MDTITPKNRNPSGTIKTCQESPMRCADVKRAMFPALQPFPQEGIVGMYPIPSVCKKQVAEHMVQFQKRLEEVYSSEPSLEARIIDYRNPNPLEECYDRLAKEIYLLAAEIEELQHMMAVDAIKKKYGTHDPHCPCYVNDR